MFAWLGLIPFGSLFSALAGIVTALINAVGPLIPRVWDAIAWYLRSFANGLTVIFHNLSTLTVICTLLLGAGWMGKKIDDKYFDTCVATQPKKPSSISVGKNLKGPYPAADGPFRRQ